VPKFQESEARKPYKATTSGIGIIQFNEFNEIGFLLLEFWGSSGEVGIGSSPYGVEKALMCNPNNPRGLVYFTYIFTIIFSAKCR